MHEQPAALPADAPGIAFDPADVLAHLTHRPGVYRMLGADGTVIYVGKARDLKRRVTSYFQGSRAHDAKTIAMPAPIQLLYSAPAGCCRISASRTGLMM